MIDVGGVQRFTGQQLDGGSCRSESVRSDGRNVVGMAVIVVFEIFEDVADVQESVTIQSNFDERRLHAGEDAGDFAFVDAADEGELFFALDVNFY